MPSVLNLTDPTRPGEIARLNQWIREVVDDLEKPRTTMGRRAASRLVGIGGGGDTTTIINNTGLDGHPSLFFGTEEKTANVLVTSFIKEQCIGTSPLVGGTGKYGMAVPLGNIDTNCSGWMARALIDNAGAGEVALAKNILDLFAAIQNPDGSWYAQYNSYTNAAGTGYDFATTPAGPTPLHASGIPDGTSGDWKTELGVASIIFAMADYSLAVSNPALFVTEVRTALSFLRDMQASLGAEFGGAMLANAQYDGSFDNVSITGNSAYCLLAMKRALDAYGTPLTTTTGYDVETMANDLYTSIVTFTWAGDPARYYNCTYPAAMNATSVPIYPFKEKMGWTQGMTILANYEWVNSGYLTATSKVYQCELGIEFLLPLNMGQWGGQFYSPYVGLAEETTDEHTVSACAMLKAMTIVNASKYINQLNATTGFIRWLAIADGRVYGQVDSDSLLWRWKSSQQTAVPVVEGYGWWSLPSAMGLLAGA